MQFSLQSKTFSIKEKQSLLKYFSKEKEYFADDSAQGDINKWPLYLALKTGNEKIFSHVVTQGGDINNKVGAQSILHRSLIELASNKVENELFGITKKILASSNQNTIEKVLLELLRTDNSSAFYQVNKETKIELANMLLDKMNYINEPLIKEIFSFGDRSIIERILSS